MATVDANGKITTKHTGNCVIYVLASNGVKTTVQVKVVSELPATAGKETAMAAFMADS